MKIQVPGAGIYNIETVVLDLNGTVSVNGKIVVGVKQRIKQINALGIKTILFSGDTQGTAVAIAKNLGVVFVKTNTAQDKLREIKKLKPTTCIAIGNGLIDASFLKAAKLGIAIMQAEGVNTKAILAADILMNSINDALDLILNEKVFISTLRK
ncbi:MAG: hypothetical protein A2537_02765 [Candidatus Magasanikbacteria bacterium RIFOXYD2_FULL_36_9]|uniref:ATPase P n=1 Tax=Candidatus Magasanikbacteria bacterium RIFOXYD2_FULL_36_9 TaxID=1798707 RepID=A0A1F6P0R8_9BACT|nr:MAG: hypothetical protein A2537_02765 [Candidatus Magasanikbacteria bacterium RIFOXYD2_FULL_36_9]